MRLNIFGFGNAAKDATAAQMAAAATGEHPALADQVKELSSPPASRSKGARSTAAQSLGSKSAAGKSRASASKLQVPPALSETLKKRVKWLLSQLEQHRERIEPALNSGDNEAFVSAMKSFQAFTAAYSDIVAYDAFEIGPAFTEYHEFFLRATLQFAWRMEERAIEEVMEASLKKGDKLKSLVGECVRGAYTRMEELPTLVDFSQFRSIVVLGCGKFPSSLFYLQDETAIPAIVGVDNDRDAAQCANALIRKFNLDRVRVIEADAATLNYSYFDAIYFGPFASPRKDVMKRIRATVRGNATIILRDPVLTGSLGLEKVLPFMEPAFTLLRSGDPINNRGRFMLRHYILKPR